MHSYVSEIFFVFSVGRFTETFRSRRQSQKSSCRQRRHPGTSLWLLRCLSRSLLQPAGKKTHLPSIWRRSHINGRIYSVLMAAPTAHESWMGAWLSVPAGALRVGGAGAAAPPHSRLIYCWSSIGSVVCCSLLFSSRNAVVDISMAIMSAAPSAGPLQTLWKFWEAWEGQTAG